MADATGYIDVVQHFLPDTRFVKSETPILPPQFRIHQIVGPVSKTSIEGKAICARFRDFILATTQGESSLSDHAQRVRAALPEYSASRDCAFQRYLRPR